MSDGPSDEQQEQERAREIALLETCHRFPGDFPLSVIANNDEAVTAAVIAVATAGGAVPVGAHDRQPSKGGKYVSHRLEVRCASAQEAHTLRIKLRAVPGVINVL